MVGASQRWYPPTVSAQRGQLQAPRPRRVGRHQCQLPAVGARAHRQQTAPRLRAGQQHGPERDVFEHMRCRQAEFAQHLQPVAFKPEHPRGLDGIAQHTMVVTAAVRTGEHGDVATVATAVEVNLHRPRVRQQRVGRTRHCMPASVGVGLEARQAVA